MKSRINIINQNVKRESIFQPKIQIVDKNKSKKRVIPIMKIETLPTMRIETQTSQKSEGISAQHDLDS